MDGALVRYDISGLNALAARLRDHIDGGEYVTHEDLRQAADVCDRLAHFRFCVAEVAAQLLDHPSWDAAAVAARDLAEALDSVAMDRSKRPRERTLAIGQ